MLELRANAARQYIDAASTFEAYEEALAEAVHVRGGMYWHKGPASAPESTYLVRTSATGGETSLGPRSPENELIYKRFRERKTISDERLAGLKAAIDEHRRMNRALRVGRVDPLVVDLLNCLAETKMGEHFRVVGTHSMYAYEAAAGVRFDAGAVATRDIDLLWDVRKRVQFATKLAKLDSSMLGILKRVDRTFRVRDSQKYTAVNKDGFEVDILRRAPVGDDPHPIRLSPDPDDFWVVQALNAHILLDSVPFSAVIVASNGAMARMNTVQPLVFAKFKRWMSERPDRDPMKRQRDDLQAKVVNEMVQRYLPDLLSDSGYHDYPEAQAAPIKLDVQIETPICASNQMTSPPASSTEPLCMRSKSAPAGL